MSVTHLNERPDLPELLLTHGDSRVRLSLQGAHISEYSVNGVELLWVSGSTRYAIGSAIRGGIPLCWPWFGASLDNDDWPQHGFARTGRFELISESSDSHSTSVVMGWDKTSSIDEWDGAAELELEVCLSDHLRMELRTINRSDDDILIGAGLHTYFAVSDREAISIPEVHGLDYLDKTQAFASCNQSEALAIRGEIDRVYLNPPSSVQLIDPEAPHIVEIEAWGNTDLVVWNPGPDVAKAMSDFDDHGYKQMVCIEPAIALDNRLTLAPGEDCRIGQSIRCVPSCA